MQTVAEQWVSDFYNHVGWKTKDGVTQDALMFEDLRPVAAEYVHACRMRINQQLPTTGDKLLDAGSGPVQFEEYQQMGADFGTHVCLDMSEEAIRRAKWSIGSKGEYIQKSLLKATLLADHYDAVVSAHVIYHIDKKKQAKAVSKLLDAVKPRQKVVIIYHNPRSLLQGLEHLLHFGKHVQNKLGLGRQLFQEEEQLYFYAHKRSWWKRFETRADVVQLPWRSMTNFLMHKLIPNNRMGKRLLQGLFQLEQKYPRIFLRIAQYNMVVMTKKKLYAA